MYSAISGKLIEQGDELNKKLRQIVGNSMPHSSSDKSKVANRINRSHDFDSINNKQEQTK